jgi:hypothetical protein
MSLRRQSGLLLAQGLLALACALTTGCMLPYAYPQISTIDSLDLVRQSSDMHAFRVDADGWMADAGVDMKDYRLSSIKLDSEGRLPSQMDFNLEYGLYIVGPLNYAVGSTHWTQVRLYRRGYQLIEVMPDKRPARMEWKPAIGVAAQEKAVDNLLWPPANERFPHSLQRDKDNTWPGSLVSPGSLASKHREALLFAAEEYERLVLVWGPKADAVTKDRLQNKARELRQQAYR